MNSVKPIVITRLDRERTGRNIFSVAAQKPVSMRRRNRRCLRNLFSNQIGPLGEHLLSLRDSECVFLPLTLYTIIDLYLHKKCNTISNCNSKNKHE